ncbi:MAG TPA: TolC family protein, partial [Polyangiaceae bacterium]|nr:TolC family protein [Polyangiaceae bacterium]
MLAPSPAAPSSPTIAPGAPGLGASPSEPAPHTSSPGAGSPVTSGGHVVPPLEIILKKAGERAPQVRLGSAALSVSQSSYTNAKRPPLGNPYFEIVGQHGSNNATQGISVIGTLWLPLEVIGQRGKRIAEADAYVELHEKSLETARAAALGEAVNAYGSAVVAAERVRVLEEIVRNSKTTADLYEARLKAGDAILRDATIARVEMGKNEVLLQDAYGRMVQAFADLARLTGEQYDGVDAAAISPPDLEVEAYLARVREQLPPAVQAAEAEAKYFASQNDRLQRESYGNFQLMLMGGRGDIGETRLGAGIAYEIPTFRTNQGEKARAQAEKLRAETERVVRQSYIETRLA